MDIYEFACLGRCNGADIEVHRGDVSSMEDWRSALAAAASGAAVVVAAYDRAAMGQTGSGHFSPIGGYHFRRDRALILDVARFKYPSHWVSAEQLWRAMKRMDPTTGLARGWLIIRPGLQSHRVSPISCCARQTVPELGTYRGVSPISAFGKNLQVSLTGRERSFWGDAAACADGPWVRTWPPAVTGCDGDQGRDL